MDESVLTGTGFEVEVGDPFEDGTLPVYVTDHVNGERYAGILTRQPGGTAHPMEAIPDDFESGTQEER